MEDVLNIPGSIHSISQEGNAVYADEVFDKRKNKKQQLVNQETDEALEAQNQRVATLEEAVGEGGSVDERIAHAKSEAESDIKGGASEDYDTLKKAEEAIKAEVNAREGAVSDEASARQDAINTAKTEIIGGASADCNTLGKAEIKISTNAQDIAQLQAAYEALTQSTPVIVEPTDTWPVASPEEGVIYRVIDRVNTPPQNYSDYMYNGTAMVLMATYDNAIDDIPTPGSNNLVKSGGVASHIVYDISEANAVGSTLATYADLAAALGNNGANIPPSIQKGGMSVKFVQSSDNNYVQYRLMSDSFSTTPSNWQGVDTEVVAGSKNLVESGGVYADELDIRKNVFNIDEGLRLATKMYVPVNVNSNIILDYLGFFAGKIKIECANATSNIFRLIGKNKETGSLLVLYNASSSAVNLPVEFDNPRPDVELIDLYIESYSGSSADTYSVTFVKDYNIYEDVADIKEENKDNKTISKVYDDFIVSGGDYITGNVGDTVNVNSLDVDSSWCRCVFDVKKGDKVTVSGIGGAGIKLLALTDSEYKVLSASAINVHNATLIASKDGYAFYNSMLNADKHIEVLSAYKTVAEISALIEEPLSEKVENKLKVTNIQGGHVYPYKIKKGKTYKVTNISQTNNTAMLLSVKETGTPQYVQDPISGLHNGFKNYSFFTADYSADYIRVYINKANGGFEIAEVETLDDRVSELEKENFTLISPAEFDIPNDKMDDISDLFATFDYANKMYQTDVIEQIYNAMDKLVALYPTVIKKYDPMASTDTTQNVIIGGQTYQITVRAYSDIKQRMALKGFTDYPEYAQGVESPITRTFDVGNGDTYNVTYEITPAYKTYLYVVSDPNSYLNTDPNYPSYFSYTKRKVLVVSGLHGNENLAPFDVYAFAYKLCNSIDGNMMNLRTSCDFYFIPYLNGYGCYHTMRPNANWVDINRNYPTNNWSLIRVSDLTEPRNPLGCQYSGASGGNQFETALVMSAVESIQPQIGIDHHNYGNNSKAQYYSCHAKNQNWRKLLSQCAVTISKELIAELSTYFGSLPKLFIGADSIAATPDYSTDNWMGENGVNMAFTVEIGSSINYLDGDVNESAATKPFYTSDVANIAEYTFRHQLVVFVNWLLKHIG